MVVARYNRVQDHVAGDSDGQVFNHRHPACRQSILLVLTACICRNLINWNCCIAIRGTRAFAFTIAFAIARAIASGFNLRLAACQRFLLCLSWSFKIRSFTGAGPFLPVSSIRSISIVSMLLVIQISNLESRLARPCSCAGNGNEKTEKKKNNGTASVVFS